MDFNHAVMWYCLAAIQYIDDLTNNEIREIGFEIGMKGRKGFDMDNPDKQYYIKSLGKEMSGLEAVSWMYVTWQNIDKNQDIGIDFKDEYETALKLFNAEKKTEDTGDKESNKFLVSYKELDVDKNTPEEEMLIRVIDHLGIKKNSIVTINPKHEEKMMIVETTGFPETMTDLDEDIFEIAVQNASRGNVKYSLKKFKSLNSKYKNNPGILENIARCYLEMERYEKAISFYEKSLEIKESVYGYIGLGNCYKKLDDINKAIENYKEAINLNPKYALSYNNLGAVYAERGEFRKAEKYLIKALELEPNNSQTLFGLGLLYRKKEELEKAKKYLIKAKKNTDKSNPLIKNIDNELNKINKKDTENRTNKTPIENEDLKKIIELSKDISGKGFKYTINNDMNQYAGIKIARKNDDHHIIYYQKGHTEILQHLIAHECGHLVRIYSAEEEDRVVPATTRETLTNAYRDIKDDIKSKYNNLSEDRLGKFIKSIYEGLVRQVTNMPVDIMIEKWIYNNYPKLHENQLKSIEKQADDAYKILNYNEKEFPKKIYFCTNVMNYVFLRLVGMSINEKFLSPFYNTKYVSPGKELAKITENEYDDSYLGDIEMINKWAKYLDIDGWFEWRDFESSNRSF